MNRILIDTNVLIYGIDKSSQFFDQSRYYLNELKAEKMICSISLSEAYSVLTRRKGYGMDTVKALQIIRWYETEFQILYPNKHSRELLHYLITAYKPKGHDIFDLEIASVALASDLKYIVTRNLKDFKNIKEINAIWDRE